MGTAHGQRGALDVADGGLQDAFTGAVVDRQVHVQLRDGNEAHVARARHVQRVVVQGGFFLVHGPLVRLLGKRFIIIHGFLQNLGVLLRVQVRHLLRVADDGAGLVEAVPVIGERRIAQQTHAHQQNQRQEQVRQAAALFLFSGFLRVLFHGLYQQSSPGNGLNIREQAQSIVYQMAKDFKGFGHGPEIFWPRGGS